MNREQNAESKLEQAAKSVKSLPTLDSLFISQPLPANTKYHVFYEDSRSLCGRYMILSKNHDFCEPVTGKEKFNSGSDCKQCFNKLKKITDAQGMDNRTNS